MLLSAVASIAALACSGGARAPDPGSPSADDPPSDDALPMVGNSGQASFISSAPPLAAPVSTEAACVARAAGVEVTREPVDIILLLDNSNSMADELEAVERSINTDFAEVLDASGVDYRVILLSRHRPLPRSSGTGESATFVCVESPLSALPDCQSIAPTEPAFSPRFFHYSLRVGSKDSLDVALDTYMPPFALGRDEFANAPGGWSAWLRDGARPVFVEMTDDDAAMSAETFIEGLVALSPERFGTPAAPRFIFHSIVGIDQKANRVAAYEPEEPLVDAACGAEVGGARVENAGPTYQRLSRMTGGLRFPLCEFEYFDVVFRAIAQNVVESRAVACSFPIPESPAQQVLNLDALSIAATVGGNEELLSFQQVEGLAACGAGSFFIDSQNIELCPAACAAVRQDAATSVSVLFGCEEAVIR